MLRILCVCGNGMGTSTILKVNIKNICAQNNIEAEVESCAFSEAMAYAATTDLILTSPEWSGMLPPSNAIVVETMNLIDVQEVSSALIGAVREHFPNELN